jgi:RNase adapter protein RapZ
MKLVIISGRSGSGKSTALHALEDAGYNCIDNFPAGLLPALVHNALTNRTQKMQPMAVSIDARNSAADLQRFPEMLLSLDRMDLDCEVIYLDALSATLVKRFSETRRRHPLTNPQTDLRQAIEAERDILSNIADLADLFIDTTQLDHPGLSDLINARIVKRQEPGMSLLFRSFGYKFGVPVDSDLVFDIRCLANPYWVPELRRLTGMDGAVERYFDTQPEVQAMHDDICRYLEAWLPKFQQSNRMYMTVAIGCTGGQHRSVYMAEKLCAHFEQHMSNVLVRHRELERLRN